MAKLISIVIVIPVYNRKSQTLSCLRRLSFIEREGVDITIVVVDDGSTDGTSEAVSNEYPEVVLLHGDGNLWWSGATNKGVLYALAHDSDYVLTLNDDVEFENDFLLHLLDPFRITANIITCGVICEFLQKNQIISAGRYAKGFLGHNFSGHLRGEDVSLLPENNYESDIESGYAMLIPVKLFRRIGLFDDKKFPHHMGDMDFVLRAKKKEVKVIVNPKAILYVTVGGNYLHNQITNKSLLFNIRSLVDIKSTVNLRTRWFFYWRHTPYCLGLLSFIYFILRISGLFALKIMISDNFLNKIIKSRRKLPV